MLILNKQYICLLCINDMSGKISLVVLMLLYFDDFIVDRKNVKIILSYNDFDLRN